MQEVILLKGIPASGKAQPIDANVLTPTGFVRIDSLKIGDKIVDPEGRTSFVTGLHPQGKKKIYEIILDDGSSCEATEEHLWALDVRRQRRIKGDWKKRDGGRYYREIVTTKYIIDRLENQKSSLKKGKRNLRIKFPQFLNPIEFGIKSELEIDPYLLGLLLGDGSMRKCSPPTITNIDDEIIDAVKAEAFKLNLKITNTSGTIQYRIVRISHKEKHNKLLKLLRENGLEGIKCDKKFVPKQYLTSSVKNRLELLQGLMDTDGTNDKNGYTEFCSTSKQLRDDVVFIARSLGILVTTGERIPLCYLKGEKIVGKKAYRAFIRQDSTTFSIFKLKRKISFYEGKLQNASASRRRAIKSIKFIRFAEAMCITVSAKSKMYITDDFIPTHNSTFAKDMIKKNPCTYKRINFDDMRMMLDDSKWSPDNEKFIIDLRDHILMQSLKKGLSVIVDNTHLHQKHENKIREIIQQYVNSSNNAVTFKIKWFHIEKKEAIERDKNRIASVGIKVIEDMFDSYSKIKNKVDSVEVIHPAYSDKVNQDTSLPKVVLVDIDGTLSDMGDRRGPFEWHKVDQDEPKQNIIDLVNTIANENGREIIFFSGRDSCCREMTMEWLKQHFDFPITLYMRPENDYRKDNLIKLELFNNHIRGNYFVDFVLDDRLQVCRMWHSLGLTVLRVGDPDANF